MTTETQHASVPLELVCRRSVDASVADRVEELTGGGGYAPRGERIVAADSELLAALQEVELRLTQAQIASNIGRPTLKDADFLRNECGRVASIARAAINKAAG